MVKIRITAPCTTPQLKLKPGDEIHVNEMTPELERLLNARRIDDETVAQVVKGSTGNQTATARNRAGETATVGA